MITTREAVTAQLMDVLRVVRGKSASAPTLDMDLIRDLKLFSDDASIVILMMEKRTGIKPPLEEWRKVGTLNQVIDLLLKYAPAEETKVKAEK
jgi:acyl carrier protein